MVVSRSWWSDPRFGNEPFTEREAWFWLLSAASFSKKPRQTHIADRTVTVGYGQLATAIRCLAANWGWHRCKVERFLTKLATETLIETGSETGVTVVTICDYTKIQTFRRETETPVETASETNLSKSKNQCSKPYQQTALNGGPGKADFVGFEEDVEEKLHEIAQSFPEATTAGTLDRNVLRLFASIHAIVPEIQTVKEPRGLNLLDEWQSVADPDTTFGIICDFLFGRIWQGQGVRSLMYFDKMVRNCAERSPCR
jgi:hypothetical protein